VGKNNQLDKVMRGCQAANGTACSSRHLSLLGTVGSSVIATNTWSFVCSVCPRIVRAPASRPPPLGKSVKSRLIPPLTPRSVSRPAFPRRA